MTAYEAGVRSGRRLTLREVIDLAQELQLVLRSAEFGKFIIELREREVLAALD